MSPRLNPATFAPRTPKDDRACTTKGIPYFIPAVACKTIGHTTNKFATNTNASARKALKSPIPIKLETNCHAGTHTTKPTHNEAVSSVENVRLVLKTGDKSSLCNHAEVFVASKDSIIESSLLSLSSSKPNGVAARSVVLLPVTNLLLLLLIPFCWVTFLLPEEKVASAEVLLSIRRRERVVKTRARAVSSFCERKLLPRVVPVVRRRDDDDDRRSIANTKKMEQKGQKFQKKSTKKEAKNANTNIWEEETRSLASAKTRTTRRKTCGRTWTPGSFFFCSLGVFLSKRISLSVDFKERGETRFARILSFFLSGHLCASLSSFVFVALTHTLFLSLSFFLALSMRTVTLTPSSSKRWRAGNEAKVVPERAAGTRR